MKSSSQQAWKIHQRFLELRSHWLTLIGEHLGDLQRSRRLIKRRQT